MVASRRVRKRSISTCPVLPTYVGLLEPLQVTLQSDHDSKRTLFILQVQRRNHNSSTHKDTEWSVSRPFEDFEVLHKRLTLALQHGHFCNAGCPWLFSFLSSEFPKKHLFQCQSSPKTVEARRDKLLDVLTSTLAFLLDRKNHACNIAAIDVAKLFAEFLYGEDAVAQAIVESYSDAETATSSNNSRSLAVLCSDDEDTASQEADNSGGRTGLPICSVCNALLFCEVENSQRLGSRASPVNNSRGRRRSSIYATTLQCGHQFHDECIVPVLNETLRCPTCNHLEIQ